MDFETAASKIVGDSICLALCVDNSFEEPYTHVESPGDPGFGIPKKLYESFKEHNCVLDVFKYSDLENWKKKKENILRNRDILILDWHLTTGDPPYKDALEILYDAVQNDSLPFVYIYTERIDLSEVVLNIYSFFSGQYKKELNKKYESFCDDIDEIPEIEDVQDILKGMKNICKEFIIHPDKEKDIRTDIFNYLMKKLEIDKKTTGKIYEKFFNIAKSNFTVSNPYDSLTYLGIILNYSFFRDEPILGIIIRKIENEEYAYLINNTIVKISTKKLPFRDEKEQFVVSPERVYEVFSKTICKRPRNFLALLGLEMRNFYRESSSAIGKDLNEIDQMAFFYHQKSLQIDEEERFHEFLKNIWKDEVSSFLLEQKPILFSVLDDYKSKHNIDKELSQMLKNPEKLVPDLSKLNYYYSMLRSKEKVSRKMRFGDIFAINPKYDDLKDDNKIPLKNSPYFLCITSQCDCIRPHKIDNYFTFVKGKEIDVRTGLNIGDTGFISYLKVDQRIVCVQWQNAPFTTHILKNNNNVSKPIKCSFINHEIVLDYLASQKENYTQRIANEAFRYASRVGIELAKL